MNLSDRNTLLEGALLLAREDVAKLRKFICGLGAYQGLRVMEEIDWEILRNKISDCRICHFRQGVPQRIAGALIAVGMKEEAEHLLDIVSQMGKLETSRLEIKDMADFGTPLRKSINKILDETGGSSGRDYFAAINKLPLDTAESL